MTSLSSNPIKTVLSTKTLLHLRNRKSYTLVIPASFLKSIDPHFGRRHRYCLIQAASEEDGTPSLMVKFTGDKT